MGLSASQARLLSITRRLNNNELQSEFISNSKIQLASKNVAASEKYINALDNTKMEYISYNETGVQEKVSLTFNALNQYTALKNQYLLYNNEGQFYVTAQDAKNYEKSRDLHAFLNCYNLIEDYEKLQEEVEDYQDLIKQWNDYYSSPEYKRYQESVAAGDPYTIFSEIVGTSDAPSSCYSAALSYPLGDCYKHVLGYLINPNDSNTYTTSTGDNISIGSNDVSGSTLSSDGKGQQIADSMGSVINSKYDDNTYIMVCDGDDDLSTDGKQNVLQTILNAGDTPTKLQLLMSDFVYDSNANTATEVKSILQKAIDMMYIIKNQSEFPELTADMMKNLLINFTDGDLKNTPTPPPTPEELGPEPQPVYKVTDETKAQWYTNLWYAMDGQTTSDEIEATYDSNADFAHFTVENAVKKTTYKKQENENFGQHYVIMEDSLASDSNWLQFALTNGTITLSQAKLQNNGDIVWEGIEFSSTSDISEVSNDEKIALAEAEYEKTIKEIQIEDKKLDQQVRKLDTEHSALEKELESIKGVMSKNVERSFAAFS